MSKKIIIDMEKCRACERCTADCLYTLHPGNNGIMALQELAAFAISCRKCTAAPCIEVCPAEALEKNDSNIIDRSVNLCVSCKSCVAICPFGTLLNDFFEPKKSICDYCDLSDDTTQLLCVKTCPENALSISEEEEDPENFVYQINEYFMVKDHKWEVLVQLE